MAAIGLLVLAIVIVVALAGILSNLGSGHQIGRSVDILGYHLTGSTGKLLLVGVILGALGMLGLQLLLVGLKRGMHKRADTRRTRKAARQETAAVAEERDHLATQLEKEHAARVAAERATAPLATTSGDLSERNAEETEKEIV